MYFSEWYWTVHIEIKNINVLIKNDAQCGYDNLTVELSQTMDNFQQQQTGRLL